MTPLSEVLSLDARVFRSVRHLMVSPGFLTREYVEDGVSATPPRLWLPEVHFSVRSVSS